MRELTPKTLQELDNFLWEDSFDSNCGKWRPYTAFRGVAKSYGNLKTSLQRLERPIKWKERRVIDSFRMYAKNELNHGVTDWDVILLGQHYRLPTRLLDWTSSPLVALFFATEKHPKENGEIYCVSGLKANDYLSTRFKDLLERHETSQFSIEILSSNFENLDKFDAVEKTVSDKSLLFFRPPCIDPRITNQSAFFSILPDPNYNPLDWLKKHKDCCRKVIIPAKLKKAIRERLSIMNISERTIYPGLEGISRWINFYYQD